MTNRAARRRQSTREVAAPQLPRAMPLFSLEGSGELAIILMLAIVPLVLFPGLTDRSRAPKQALVLMLAALALVSICFRGYRGPKSRVFWYAVAGLAAAELIEFATASDILGSIFGRYFIRTGVVVQISLLLFMAHAAAYGEDEAAHGRLLRWGGIAFALVAAYTILMRAGLDPVSDNFPGPPTSTLANPNDLAGFNVMGLAFFGPAVFFVPWFRTRRVRIGVLMALILAAEMVAFYSESRSGFSALILGLLLVGGFALLNGWPRRDVLQTGAFAAGTLLVGLLIAIPSGDAKVLSNRFARAVPREAEGALLTDSFSIRFEIWRGSLAVIEAHPLTGTGQSGMRPEFDRHRPADLTGRFNELDANGADPGVASPHSWPLEVLTQGGFVLAVPVTVFLVWLALGYWKLLRRERSVTLPFIGAGLVAYAVYAAASPIVLVHIIPLSVIVGLLAGRCVPLAKPSWAPPSGLRNAATLAAGLYFLVALVVGLGLIWGDLRYKRVLTGGVNLANAEEAEQLASLYPWEQSYRRSEARRFTLVAHEFKLRSSLETALRKQGQLIGDFQPVGLDYLNLAELRLDLGLPGVEEALQQAHNASPHGVNTAVDIDRIRTRMILEKK